MIILKILFILVFALAWLKSRKSKTVEPSDFFVLSFLAIYVPAFLLNPSGETTLNGLQLPAGAAARAEIGMMVVMALATMMLVLRNYVEQKIPSLRTTHTAISSQHLSFVLAKGAIIVMLVCLCVLMISAEFREFKLDIVKFFTFQFQGIEYRILRNEKYTNSWIVESVIGRARFTVLPILFCLALYPLLKARRLFVAGIAACIVFIALPGSLSKLPIFFFIGYTVILGASNAPRLLDIRLISAMLMIATALTVTMLILLYTAQYQNAVVNGSVQPLNLAIERIWGETYSVVVRYFSVYPDMLPYAGWSGINTIAKLFGLSPRLPDIEVARAVLGPDSGSNPGVFFLGGYAAFGMVGLGIFTVLGYLVLWGLDIVGREIRTAPLRSTYLAVVGMNAVFLNQISLQTALVTYGLAFVPACIFVLDRFVVARGLHLDIKRDDEAAKSA